MSKFTQAIQLLRTNDFSQTSENLQVLYSHKQLCQDKYNSELAELRRLLIMFKKHESLINKQKQGIVDEQIQPWVPLLKKMQDSAVFPDVKAATVTQIVDSKKEMDKLDTSLEEMKLRLFFQARNATFASNDLQKVETQIFILETAEDVMGQFNRHGFKIQELSDYEIPKYFNLYRKAGEERG